MFRLDRHGSSPAREAATEAATGTAWTTRAEVGQPRSAGPEIRSASAVPCLRGMTLRRLRRAGAVPVATPVPDLESFDTRAKTITWTVAVVPTATASRSGGSEVTTSTAKDRRPVRTRTCTITRVTAVGRTRGVVPTIGRSRRPLRIRRRHL